MIEFHDYDVLHPFAVVGEKHVVIDRKITLNYAPLKGSVNIAGYVEDTSLPLVGSSFYIDYDEENNYRAANQVVQFSSDAEGKEVVANYRGVSTLLRAKHLNEIKDFMERGASEMAAGLIVAHEAALVNYFDDRMSEITEALQEIRNAILAVAEDGDGGARLPVILVKPPKKRPKDSGNVIATDEEYHSVIDGIFPDDN